MGVLEQQICRLRGFGVAASRWGIDDLADSIPRDAEHLLVFNEVRLTCEIPATSLLGVLLALLPDTAH